MSPDIQFEDTALALVYALVPDAEDLAHVVVVGEIIKAGKDLGKEFRLIDTGIIVELRDLEDIERLAGSLKLAVVNEDSVGLVPAVARGELCSLSIAKLLPAVLVWWLSAW